MNRIEWKKGEKKWKEGNAYCTRHKAISHSFWSCLFTSTSLSNIKEQCCMNIEYVHIVQVYRGDVIWKSHDKKSKSKTKSQSTTRHFNNTTKRIEPCQKRDGKKQRNHVARENYIERKSRTAWTKKKEEPVTSNTSVREWKRESKKIVKDQIGLAKTKAFS